MRFKTLLVALAFTAMPVWAHIPTFPANAIPACTDGIPNLIAVRLAAANTCDGTAGTAEVYCKCQDGVWSALGSGGGGNSFETINAPSGTDPVADSSTDTLNLASGAAALSITGDSATDTITLDIAGTASKCARFDGSGELVPASGDCASGDTGGSGLTHPEVMARVSVRF